MTQVAARAARLAEAFRDRLGRPPDGVWSAPGRANLMGEHTDYNDGLVLPFAIDREALAAVAVRDDDVVTCASLDRPGRAAARIGELAPGAVQGWPAYVLGVVWALREAGVDARGLDILVASDVPSGAGVSSSAALECAVALAVAQLAGAFTASAADRTRLAIAARRAETEMVGAPVGVMDQMAALHGWAGCALLLDCRTLTVERIALRPHDLGLRLVLVDTRVSHANAGGGYAARRRACERAARLLGVPALRDATLDRVEAELAGDARRRARHVVTEIERVRRTAGAFGGGDVALLGELFAASHASMRDDFQISCPELDVAVEASLGAGAVAARMTGGGLGGCAVALVPADLLGKVAVGVTKAFESAGFAAPDVFEVQPSDGAARVA